MFAPLNGAPLNGGAAGLWLTADAHASAEAACSPTVLRRTDGVLEAKAIAYSEPERTARYTDQTKDAAAEISMVALRTAFMDAVAEGQAASSGEVYGLIDMQAVAEPTADTSALNRVTRWSTLDDGVATAELPLFATRFAPMDAVQSASAEIALEATRYARMLDSVVEAWADKSGESVRHAYMEANDPGSESFAVGHAWPVRWAQPEAVDDAWAESVNDEWLTVVTKWMAPRNGNAVGQTFIAESHITRLRVNQVRFRGSAICRATSYSIPNAQLGRGLLEAWAEPATTPPRITRPATGVIESFAEVFEDIGKTSVISANMSGEASTVIASTVIRGGIRYNYFYGSPKECEAATSADGLVPQWVSLLAAETEAFVEATPYARRRGRAVASSGAIPAIQGRINKWRRFDRERAVAAASFTPYTFVRTTGIAGEPSEAVAFVQMAGEIHRYAAASANAEAVATGAQPLGISDTAFSSADALATSEAAAQQVARHMQAEPIEREAVSIAEAKQVARHMTPVPLEGTAATQSDNIRTRMVELDTAFGEAIVASDGLRWAWMDGVSVTQAMAAGKAPTFKINASDPAPMRRVIVLTPGDRELYLPPSGREYRVA